MSVKDTDGMPVIPEQWKPENQDPSVAYSVNHITGEVTYFGDSPEVEDAPKRKGGRPKKVEEPAEEPAVEAVEEPVEEPAEEPVEEPAEEPAVEE